MNCIRRDENLLLLVHDELPPLRRLATNAHLKRCARCRERHARFAAVSALAAGAIRGAEAPQWSASRASGRPRPRSLWGLSPAMGLLMLLVALLSLVICVGVARLRENSPRAAIQKPSPGGCTPGLPSDRCR